MCEQASVRTREKNLMHASVLPARETHAPGKGCPLLPNIGVYYVFRLTYAPGRRGTIVPYDKRIKPLPSLDIQWHPLGDQRRTDAKRIKNKS